MSNATPTMQQGTDRLEDVQGNDCKWFERACIVVIWLVAALNGLLRWLGML